MTSASTTQTSTTSETSSEPLLSSLLSEAPSSVASSSSSLPTTPSPSSSSSFWTDDVILTFSIVGGSVGLIVLAVMVAVICYCCRKRFGYLPDGKKNANYHNAFSGHHHPSALPKTLAQLYDGNIELQVLSPSSLGRQHRQTGHTNHAVNDHRDDELATTQVWCQTDGSVSRQFPNSAKRADMFPSRALQRPQERMESNYLRSPVDGRHVRSDSPPPRRSSPRAGGGFGSVSKLYEGTPEEQLASTEHLYEFCDNEPHGGRREQPSRRSRAGFDASDTDGRGRASTTAHLQHLNGSRHRLYDRRPNYPGNSRRSMRLSTDVPEIAVSGYRPGAVLHYGATAPDFHRRLETHHDSSGAYSQNSIDNVHDVRLPTRGALAIQSGKPADAPFIPLQPVLNMNALRRKLRSENTRQYTRDILKGHPRLPSNVPRYPISSTERLAAHRDPMPGLNVDLHSGRIRLDMNRGGLDVWETDVDSYALDPKLEPGAVVFYTGKQHAGY